MSTPSLPRPTGFITQTPGGEARDVAILATHAYVPNGNDILVVDVADPSAPSTVTTIPGDALHVSVRGATLYAFGSDVRAIDISRPESPRFVVAEAQAAGKAGAEIDAEVEKKLKKFYEETCLVQQPYVLGDKVTIGSMITQGITDLKETIVVRRVVRYELGA